MPCPSDAVIASFVDGSLPDHESAALETHLDGCASCRQTVSAAVRAPGDQRLGRYQLLAPLGAGAMGTVYAAFDPDLDRKIAIKVLAPLADPARRRDRLAREARALAKVSHPNVVAVHDVGLANDRLFLAMELVDGETLRERAARVSVRERLALVLGAARGLDAAHAAGVVHRDFKPDNVLVGNDRRVRVGDFGLAGELPSAALAGTPAYMAPEQLRGEPASAASDQFALCVTAWELLFGARPFAGGTAAELEATMRVPPSDPPGGDRRLARVLRRGLAHDPTARYPSVAALIAALEPPPRRRAAPSIVAGACVAVAGVVLLGGGHRDPCDAASAPLAAAWSPSARTELAVGLVRSGSPLAADAVPRAIRAIDARVASWSAQIGDACHARRDDLLTPERYQARADCLDQRAGELAALLDVLAHADRGTVANAPFAVDSLGELTCAPRTAAALPERRHLAAAKALRVAGRFRDALAELQSINDAPDPDVAAETELELGVSSNALGEVAPARDHLSRAAAKADAARDDRIRALSLLELLEVVGSRTSDRAEAARIEDQAIAAVERAGNEPRMQALLAKRRGDLALNGGRFPAAIELLDDAVARFRAQVPLDEIRLADALSSAAGPRELTGDHAGALARYEEALHLFEHAVGPDHPHVASVLGSMVATLYNVGKHAESIAAARRSIAILERAIGPNDPDLATVVGNLGATLAREGQLDGALAAFERERTILEATYGPVHTDIANAWNNIANAQAMLGRRGDAIASFERAIAIWEQAAGTDSVYLAPPLAGLAQLVDRTRSIALLERAIAIETAHPGDPDELAEHRRMLATLR